jgi:hypothetical protein
MAYVTRATRFPLHLPLLYRESGTDPWQESSTVNISRTGILFETGQALPLQTVVEMRIKIPLPSQATLFCRGPVVRKQDSILPETRSLLAALIQTGHLRPTKKKVMDRPGAGSTLVED